MQPAGEDANGTGPTLHCAMSHSAVASHPGVDDVAAQDVLDPGADRRPLVL
jgi:hypothetical protein